MAQTGFTPILIYSSSTTTNAPAAGSLTNSTLGSELAINITDGKLFYKDNAGVVQVIGWKVVPATAGGTGQTSYVVGDILFADTATTLSKLADVATGNALISGGVGVAPSYGKIGLTTHITGVLPVANGGSGTATAFTAGSVVFAGASGVYSQKNANLFWDNSSNRLGINTASPATALHVTDSSATTAATVTPLTIQAITSGTAANNFGSTIEFNAQASDGSTYAQSTISSLWTDATAATRSSALTFATRISAGAITERMRIEPGGDIKAVTGNLVIGTSGKGIDFSATPGTGTSELLADYEEGAWTPAISYSTSNGNLSQAIQAGRYVKVGQQVTVVGYVLFGETTASGDISVTGLPFVMQNTANLNGGFGVYVDNMSGLSGGVTGMLASNTSAFSLAYSGTGVQTALTNANTGTNNNVVRFCFSYITN